MKAAESLLPPESRDRPADGQPRACVGRARFASKAQSDRHYWATRYERYAELVAALDAPFPDDLNGFFPTNLKERSW